MTWDEYVATWPPERRQDMESSGAAGTWREHFEAGVRAGALAGRASVAPLKVGDLVTPKLDSPAVSVAALDDGGLPCARHGGHFRTTVTFPATAFRPGTAAKVRLFGAAVSADETSVVLDVRHG